MAGDPDLTDGLVNGDCLTGLNVDLIEVGVKRVQTLTVVNKDVVTIGEILVFN